MDKFCSKCGKPFSLMAEFCDYCGNRIIQAPPPLPPSMQGDQNFGDQQISGQFIYRPNITRPPETYGWSWGAFGLPLIWGIAMNQAGIAILSAVLTICFAIPFINLLAIIGYPIVVIYFGIKGYELAWNSREWASPQQFKETQKVWNICGIFSTIIGLLLLVAWISITVYFVKSVMTGDSPLFGDIFPNQRNLNSMVSEAELKAYGHSIQLSLERYATDDPNTCYPKDIKFLNAKGYNATYTNPITKKPVNPVEYGSFSAGDFSYLVSNSPKNDGYILVVYGENLKPAAPSPYDYEKHVQKIKGFGGEGVILVLDSLYDTTTNTYKVTDSVSNKKYTVTRDKDGVFVISK